LNGLANVEPAERFEGSGIVCLVRRNPLPLGEIERAARLCSQVGRLAADPDYSRAEYAILVRSDLQGRGLGWSLMEHLLAYARAEGLGKIEGFVLADNTEMLSMVREFGFSVDREAGEPGLMRVEIPLARDL
jgi:acetyltransferase